MGTQKNHLNEMVLLSTQNMLKLMDKKILKIFYLSVWLVMPLQALKALMRQLVTKLLFRSVVAQFVDSGLKGGEFETHWRHWAGFFIFCLVLDRKSSWHDWKIVDWDVKPQDKQCERSGSVVECLTRDGRAAGSSITGVTVLWSLSKTHLS